MLKRNDKITLIFSLVGIFILIVILLSPHIGELTSQKVITKIPNWFTIFGVIYIILPIAFNLKAFKRYRERNIRKAHYVENISLIFLLVSLIFTAGYTYGQYDKMIHIKSQNINILNDQANMMNKMEIISENCSLNNKKVIIRDDDVGIYNWNESLKWLSNLTDEKGIKITYAVVTLPASENDSLINYLSTLNKNNSELAIHGYKHENLYGKPYEEQYDIIRNSTEIAEKYLRFKPSTFIPPYNKGDVNTTKVCRILGYHTITDVREYPLYLKNINSSFNWDKGYHPPKHQSFEQFKTSFDSYYNSSAEFFVICIHDWTFVGKNNKLDLEKTANFEKAIDYMMNKNVQFMTIEEAYQWSVDENSIVYGLINESSYFVDLRECKYNHTMRISQIPKNTQCITIYNVDLQEKVTYSKKNIGSLEFKVQPGYLYYIQY